MVPFNSYRGKKILVTGLTGFKGLWLASWLEALGAQVQGLALPPEPEMDARWPEIQQRFSCWIGDICDQNTVQAAVRAFQPEIIFHLAAQSLVRRSYTHPVATFATNVMGTVHVLEAARQVPEIRYVIVVTSDKCYHNRETLRGYLETDAMGGHDPYSASKGCAELVTAAYRLSYGEEGEPGTHKQIASVRAGNVIGGGDWAVDRIVPDFIRAMLAGQPLVLRRPDATRPWLHVLEALSGYLLLGEHLHHFQRSGKQRGESLASAWNFGPPQQDVLPVRDLAQALVDRWGTGVVREEPVRTGPHEASRLFLDASKALRVLGWLPMLTAKERVAWTVDWYKGWSQNPSSAWRLTDQQIQRFQSRWQGADVLAEVA